MTEHDLATMLRDHVADDPPFDDHAAHALLSRGRRNVRRTRLTIAAGGLAACVLATAVGAPYLTRSDTPPDRLIDPAVAKAIAAYDVTKMPATMDEHARTVLESSVPDLGDPPMATSPSPRSARSAFNNPEGEACRVGATSSQPSRPKTSARFPQIASGSPNT